ncbi:MAG TPA: helix-turn-helix transcriptional regulator [Thermoanaerobaculia bacterium]|nr:helix-turn-helix transcriptional regulator [Thermoanaerobaculia bacterium]
MASMVGEKLRETRLAQQRSLADVAGKAKISVATLSRIENAKQSLDVGLFLQLARILNVPAHELLGDNGAGNDQVDPLVRRIAALGARERLDLWRDLANERRASLAKKKGGDVRHVGQQVEELLAQVDFLRDELESVRKRVKRR